MEEMTVLEHTDSFAKCETKLIKNNRISEDQALIMKKEQSFTQIFIALVEGYNAFLRLAALDDSTTEKAPFIYNNDAVNAFDKQKKHFSSFTMIVFLESWGSFQCFCGNISCRGRSSTCANANV